MTLEHNPFEAPKAEAGVIEARAMEYFKPLGGLGILAILTIAGVIFFRLCYSVLDYQVFRVLEAVGNGTLEGPEAMAAALAGPGSLLQIVAPVMVLFFLVSVIITLMWIYRAHSNLPALGAGHIKYTPGWCVAYWFIPIVSLYRPYQAMCELMNGSSPNRHADHSADTATLPPQSGSLLLGFWWLFFIAMVFVSRVSNRVNMSESQDFGLSFGLDTAETVLTVISGLLTITVIRRVGAFQKLRREQVLAVEGGSDSE